MSATKTIRTLLVAVAALAAGVAAASGDVLTGTCTKVVDGDTLVVDADGRRVTVELAGVDAPELGEPFGKEVRVFVRQMVQWTEVSVDVDHWDGDTAHGRVTAGGGDLSTVLAGHGLARVTGDTVDTAELEALSKRARRVPSGIWLRHDPAVPQGTDVSAS